MLIILCGALFGSKLKASTDKASSHFYCPCTKRTCGTLVSDFRTYASIHASISYCQPGTIHERGHEGKGATKRRPKKRLTELHRYLRLSQPIRPRAKNGIKIYMLSSFTHARRKKQPVICIEYVHNILKALLYGVRLRQPLPAAKRLCRVPAGTIVYPPRKQHNWLCTDRRVDPGHPPSGFKAQGSAKPKRRGSNWSGGAPRLSPPSTTPPHPLGNAAAAADAAGGRNLPKQCLSGLR